MGPVSYRQSRLRRLIDAPVASGGDYVLYWTQVYRRLERNHALDYALRCAEELGRPLVVYEGLRIDYHWASQRHHRFVLEGMQANATRAAELGLSYWPFVETEKGQGRGLLRRLSERACLVVTDDFPCFILPAQAEALARKVAVPVFAVDSNSVVPLSLLGPAVSAAAQLRPRIHKAFAEAWPHRAAAKPRVPDVVTKRVKAPFDTWKAKDVAAFVDALPVDSSVPAVEGMPGGAPAARARLREFLRRRLRGYAEARSEPGSPAEAYRTLEHLNNKYALDGRDPNSYTGILWCFGLFDRPWPPERKIFGSVRYMSSENTARKFDVKPYYAYIEGLPTIAEARSGRTA